MIQIKLTESKKEQLAQKYIDYICKRHGLDQESREAQLIYYAYMHGMNNCLDELNRKENVVITQYIDKDSLIKESEDERISAEIRDFISWANDRGCITKEQREKTASWFSWLEDEGEHAKFRNSIQVGDKVTRNEDGVLVNLSQLNRVAKKDEKQGEQKSAWSEEDENMLKMVIESCEQCGNGYAYYWLKHFKDRVQPENTWKPSDAQMKCISDVVADAKYKNDISTNGYEPYTHLYTLLQQLKKLREE